MLSESVVTAENACFVAVMPATVTTNVPSVSDCHALGLGTGHVPVSIIFGPETLDPSPYEVLNIPPIDWDVFDAARLYFCFPLQGALEHCSEGTQRSADPAIPCTQHTQYWMGWGRHTVKVDEEVLRRGPDCYLTGPLCVFFIDGGFALASRKSASALDCTNRSDICALP